MNNRQPHPNTVCHWLKFSFRYDVCILHKPFCKLSNEIHSKTLGLGKHNIMNVQHGICLLEIQYFIHSSVPMNRVKLKKKENL